VHIVLGLLAVLGGAAFWWYRMRYISDAASEVHDMAGRAWGKYKRHKFRKKAESAPVESVEDPVAAAVVMMLAVAKTDGPLSAQSEQLIEKIAREEMAIDDTTELMTFAKWVDKHVHDANDVARRYSKLWGNALNMDERRELVDMVRRVAEADGAVSREKEITISRLRERLGFTN
jgi:uncharacterized tellurite resistance protein B-like protein